MASPKSDSDLLNFSERKGLLDTLFYDLGKQANDFEVSIMSKEGEKTKSSKWRKYSELCFDSEDKESRWFIERVNNRTILDNEVVLDLEEPGRYDEITTRLKEEGLFYKAYRTGSRGFHFHLFFNKPLKEDHKKEIIERYGCDLQKSAGRCMIALEDAPHWKTGKRKLLVAEVPGINYFQIEEEPSKQPLERENILHLIIAKQTDKMTEILAKEFLSNNHVFSTRDDAKSEVWIYEDGIYKPNGESHIKEFCRNILEESYTSQRANLVIEKIRVDTFIDPDKFFSMERENLAEIPVKNGILNIFTRTILPFTPRKVFFNKLPVVFDENKDCPEIKRFFFEVLKEEDDATVMFELFGFCLLKEYRYEKAFMFVGDGRNGKGKTISLFRRFLGPGNYCSVPLDQMKSDSSGICELFGKLANTAGDLSNNSLRDTGPLKSLTGRDAVNAKRKYLRDLTFVNHAKIIFACNELPRVYDFSKGFWSRWVLMEFPYEFANEREFDEQNVKHKREDPQIIDKLSSEEELSGLLNEALSGLKRLIENKGFSYSKGTSEVKEYWIRKSDSFTGFCMDCLEEDEKGIISKKDLRRAFNKYCKTHKIKGASDKSIKVTLQDLFGATDSYKSRRVLFGEDSEGQENVWEGVKFNSMKDMRGNSAYSEKKNMPKAENPLISFIPLKKEEILGAGYSEAEALQILEEIKGLPKPEQPNSHKREKPSPEAP